jgi:hypothetical protein
MHVYHQQLPALEEMDCEEVVEWGRDALDLLKALNKGRGCPLL